MSHHQPQAPENGNARNVSVEKLQHEMSNTVVDAEMTPLVKDEGKAGSRPGTTTFPQQLKLGKIIRISSYYASGI